MKSQTGFTLAELMITVAITAILAAVAAPSFTSVISDDRIASRANELYGEILYARSEAIKRNQALVLCPSTNGLSCSNDSDGRQSWQGQWMAAAVNNSNNDLTSDNSFANSDYLFVNDKQSNLSIYYTQGSTLDILADGSIANAGHFTICDSSNSQGVKIEIIGSGRPYITELGEQDYCGA